MMESECATRRVINSPEKEETKTIAVDALMALYGGDNYADNVDIRDRDMVLGRSLQYKNNNDQGRNHRSRHCVHDDDNRDQGREDGAYDRAAALLFSSSYTPGVKGREQGEGSQQRHCHRDDGSEGSTDMGCELVGLVNSREIICTVIMPTASLDSCCYSDFLSHNHSLTQIAKEIFDDLFCNPIRTPVVLPFLTFACVVRIFSSTKSTIVMQAFGCAMASL